MDEILTVDEMKDRFRDEWVLVEDPDADENLVVKGGRVRFRSKAKDDIYQKAAELRPKHGAFVYAGEWKLPENMAALVSVWSPKGGPS